MSLPIHRRFGHGGARRGAGRKRTSELQSHVARPRFSRREPIHVTLRLVDGLPDIRRRAVYSCLRQAILGARARGLSIAHFSVLSNHIHLIMEAQDRKALSRQMQSLCISFAKRLNAVLGRAGSVFRDRYHAHVLRTPRETRNAVRYVLCNELRHRGMRGRIDLDAYSSAPLVRDETWMMLLGESWRARVGFPGGLDPRDGSAVIDSVRELVAAPRCWLLRVGWARARGE